MAITYRTDTTPATEQVIEVYASAGLNRPIDDFDRIAKMYQNSNLIITAWDGEDLVGVSRALTDFCYACYLSDLAVKEQYKHQGIGKKLVELTKEHAGPQSMLLLLAAPQAMEYYPKIGMPNIENAFMIKREI
ncbi:GNAT family N-acetyltransferase [Mucilaginibacter sp. KACC 22063]|uniref:GNAT family N-acetyltransferase n=1 Tax=Mucilaginibacter sp. KACC 22063 TaxID=3025666 RepID=UPI00236657C6|nr:GNAT family N-acetyltransferase [Mucilaginibacter sp. KACC 22063]WDF55360.1 GNAT family N-acetyltransferase [Mucilaginibacter sp. KACC 22063]